MDPQDRYRPPSAPLVGTGPGDDEIRAFLGDNAEYYLRKWRRIRAGESSLAGFNWAAALFTGPWLAYRRLYVYILPALLLPPVTEALLALVVTAGSSAFVVSQLVSGVALLVGYGFAGNAILYRRAFRASEVSAGDAERIAARGGTSELGMWLVVLAYAALFVGGFALASNPRLAG